MEHIINIEGIKLFAYHGCLEEEALIGGNYIIDVHITTDFSEATETDELSKTIDYCAIYDLCKKQMAVRSKLIEQVCDRIHKNIRSEFPGIQKLHVKLTKLLPPLNGDVRQASVEIKE